CRPPPGRELGHLTEACLLARCVRLRLHPNHDRATRALIVALRTCAQRAQAHDDLQLPGREISTLVDELAPGLRVEPGVGPVGAAIFALFALGFSLAIVTAPRRASGMALRSCGAKRGESFAVSPPVSRRMPIILCLLR